MMDTQPSRSKPFRREMGQANPDLPPPLCYQKQFLLTSPEVCAYVCIYGFTGNNTCDTDPQF